MSLHRPPAPPDWQDVHAGPVAPDITSARSAYETAFSRLPRWVDTALRLRDGVVGRLGLATVTEGAIDMTRLPVIEETDRHYEVGLADKHLTFTLATRLDPGRVSLTTRIWFNHWSGRAYLALVLIPHKIIARHAVRSLG